MPNKKSKSHSKLIRSFGYAFKGIAFLFKTQLNARIELAFALAVLFAGILLQISNLEWALSILCMGLVMSLEAMNTAIELLADKLHPDFDKSIGRLKDVAAGSVLIGSIMAAIVGLIIFLPKIIELFKH